MQKEVFLPLMNHFSPYLEATLVVPKEPVKGSALENPEKQFKDWLKGLGFSVLSL